MAETADFHLVEYKCLRDEILQQKDSFTEIARNALIGSAAVIAWLATSEARKIGILYHLAWWMPLIICIGSWLQVINNHYEMHTLAKYLHRIERQYSQNVLGGWEHFKSAKENSSIFETNSIVLPIFWLLFTAATFVIGILGSLIQTS